MLPPVRIQTRCAQVPPSEEIRRHVLCARGAGVPWSAGERGTIQGGMRLAGSTGVCSWQNSLDAAAVVLGEEACALACTRSFFVSDTNGVGIRVSKGKSPGSQGFR